MKTFIFLLLNAVAFAAHVDLPKQYTISGRIKLPYAEIDEPFTAYYDEPANKSRIGYYDDLMITLQRADLKEFYKLSYYVNSEGVTERICFNMAASPIAPVTVTSVLPNLTNFKLVDTFDCEGDYKFVEGRNGKCLKYYYTYKFGEKVNKYTFIFANLKNGPPVPVYYLMMGYDTLMGSHYDKYEVFYEKVSIGPVDPSVFDIQKDYTCRGFPGPGAEAIVRMNPMHEFISGDTSHIDHSFKEFKTKHGKKYNSDKEHAIRKTNYHQNYRFIESHNRKNAHFKLAINHLADFNGIELRKMKGLLRSKVDYNGGLAMNLADANTTRFPDQWDWRLLGAVTPVKDQAICGSCWTFGTSGTIEGAYFVKTGKQLRLSQQQMIDCAWTQQNNGCDGGEDFRAYEYIMQAGGLATEEDYGHYLAVDGKCHDTDTKKSVQIKGFYNVTTNVPREMELALFKYGPLSISVDASPKTFTFYSSGVYYDPACSSTDLDHSVLAVGYGMLKGQRYWLVKNSWSTYWGNDGYILISQKDNNCGVMTAPTSPIIA